MKTLKNKHKKIFKHTRSKRQRGGTNNLIEASREGDLAIVTMLLENGADVDMKDNEGWTALIWASSTGRTGIVIELLKKGANVNAKSDFGISALHIASVNGRTEIVRELLKNDADVNAKNNDGYTALMWASRFGHREIVRELLKNGADVNATANDGSTAFMWASEKGHIEIVNLLEMAIKGEQIRKDTKQKALELVTNRVGKVPSLQTLAHRNLDTHSTLLYNTARMDGSVPPIRSKLGGKRKTRKSKKFKKSKKTRSRRQRGGDQEEKDNYLFDAIGLDDPDKVVRALRIGANVNARNAISTTALMEASSLGYEEIVRELLNNAAVVDMVDNDGWTALIWASATGRGGKELVRELLKNGANVNAMSNTGISALHMASNDGYTEIVRELLNNGADVNAKNNDGETALMWASVRGHTEIVNLLEKAIKTEQIRRDNKRKAMELVTSRNTKVPSLQTLAHRKIDTHNAVLYNTARMDGAVPPIGSKLGGKRKTRRIKNKK